MLGTAAEDESSPLLLVRQTTSAAEDAFFVADAEHPTRHPDRLRPGIAGFVAGLFAGAAALGVVHAIHPLRLSHSIQVVAQKLGSSSELALGLAYAFAAVGGALVGHAFARITRHLRRFVPLVVWAVVFFVSLAMLILALSATYGHGVGVNMAPAVLAASAVFGLVVAFQLPLRRRD